MNIAHAHIQLEILYLNYRHVCTHTRNSNPTPYDEYKQEAKDQNEEGNLEQLLFPPIITQPNIEQV